MRYLKKFANQSKYVEYIDADDIWLPRVSLIYNKGDAHTVSDKFNNNGPSRVEYSRLGTEFIVVANGGIMYFTDKTYGNVKYTAAIDDDTIVIKTTDLTTGELTDDAYIDEDNNQIVVNYPTGTAQTYSLSSFV